MKEIDPRRITEAPAPPISSRSQPRFTSTSRKTELAQAFLTQGAEYDHLRPGYPDSIVAAMLEAARTEAAGQSFSHCSPMGKRELSPHSDPASLHAIDLGAGTGKLSLALYERGCLVTAVDPSGEMLRIARKHAACVQHARTGSERELHDAGSGKYAGEDDVGTFEIQETSAEATGLPPCSAHLITAAQAWHWFDAERASAEVVRLLAPGGVLALVWNTLDVTIPWVHRYSRIAHAGDIQREDFEPEVGAGLRLENRIVHHWQDRRPTWDFVNLAKTRSYAITATPKRRAQVLNNLEWYLHDFLGYEPGAELGMPYRTDLFLYRATPTT